jgi:hypothetical protein
MKRATRSVLRKLGTDMSLDAEREANLTREVDEAQQGQRRHTGDSRDDSGLSAVPEELLTESEKRHEGYRRRQAMGGKFPPAAERLPIMTSEERQERDKSRPKWRATSFEGPIEKLLDKYGPDLDEVERHLTLGQSMKYEFIDGKVLDREGNVIYEGGALTGSSN